VSLIRCRLLLWLASSTALGEQLPMVVFSASDGLHTTVPRIVADSKGFVWLPGSEGLARFDGNGFRIFTPADGLPASIPSDIVERRDGTYWVAVQEHLCLFDPRPDRKRFQCESPKLGAIRRLLEDERGLWCGTSTGLWRRTQSWEQVSAIQPTAPGRSVAVRGLLKDSRGDVWAATYSGLYRFRTDGRVDRWTSARGLAADFVTTVAETPDAIWAGTLIELARFRIDPRTGDARIADRYNRSHGLPSSNIFAVHWSRGSVWAATSQGLGRQLPSGRWEAVGLDPSLSGFSLESLATDLLGNLWAGTDGGGDDRVSGSAISSFSERDGLLIRKVSAIIEDRKGDLMAVTKDEGQHALNRFDGYHFHPLRPQVPPGVAWGPGWSQIAVQSRSGDWWLATGSGLLHYPQHLRRAPRIRLPKRNIFRVFEDSRGALWASIHDISNHGLWRRDPGTGRWESWDESHGLPSLRVHENLPSAFAENRDGGLWIGMLDGGLVRFQNGRFQQFPAASGAPDQGVRALLVDRQGRLWVAARRRGLLRVDDPSAAHPAFFAYTRSSGLSENTILALAEDLAGRIYAASGRGIDRLDPATGRVHRFATPDGLPPGELRVAFRDRHGALWFGGDQGLVRIEPQEERTEPPAVLVYSIRVNGRARPISDLGEAEPALLSLSASERQLQVDFGGFRHDLAYQTRLSGIDRDWTVASPRAASTICRWPRAATSSRFVRLLPTAPSVPVRRACSSALRRRCGSAGGSCSSPAPPWPRWVTPFTATAWRKRSRWSACEPASPRICTTISAPASPRSPS
jgi:ligand-binding sensor domain-containing protein